MYGAHSAITLVKAGDKYLKCGAHQVNPDGLASFDKTRAMLEKICDSVAIK